MHEILFAFVKEFHRLWFCRIFSSDCQGTISAQDPFKLDFNVTQSYKSDAWKFHCNAVLDQITLKWMPGSSQSAAANSGSGESADAISGQAAATTSSSGESADAISGQSANATSAGNETPKSEKDNTIEKPSLEDIFKNSRIYLPNEIENEMARNAKTTRFIDKKGSKKATLTTLDLSKGQPKGAIMFMEGLKDDTTKEDIKAALMDQFNVEVDFDFVFMKFRKGHYEKYAVEKGHYIRFLEKNEAINLAAKITERGGTEAGLKLKIKKVDLDFRVLEGREENNYLREERKRLRKIREFNAPWWNTSFHNLRKKVQAAKR